MELKRVWCWCWPCCGSMHFLSLVQCCERKTLFLPHPLITEYDNITGQISELGLQGERQADLEDRGRGYPDKLRMQYGGFKCKDGEGIGCDYSLREKSDQQWKFWDCGKKWDVSWEQNIWALRERLSLVSASVVDWWQGDTLISALMLHVLPSLLCV